MPNIQTVSKFVDAVCAKYGKERHDVLAHSASVRRKLLLSKIPRDTVAASAIPHIVVQHGVAVGEIRDGVAVPLTLEGVETCKQMRIPFELPANLNGSSLEISSEIRAYVESDSEDDDE